MAGIYLGYTGHIELERTSNNLPIYSQLDPEDVNASRKRFSLDQGATSLITGDKIEISTKDGANLQLVSGHNFPDWTGFCHVDAAGGIRLYDAYQSSINGEESNALALTAPSAAQDITVGLAQGRFRCIGNVREYSITTSRETVDVSTLGEEFRRNYTNGMISGQGQLVCLWDYEAARCKDSTVTYPHYLSQLVLRTKLGGAFKGRFFLDATEAPYIWYEALCIVSNVAMNFSPTEPITSSIDFVTSGPVELKMGVPEYALLQEDANLVLQEDDESSILLDS